MFRSEINSIFEVLTRLFNFFEWKNIILEAIYTYLLFLSNYKIKFLQVAYFADC